MAVLRGNTCIADTHPEICRLLKNPEEGKSTSFGSRKRLIFICPICKSEINGQIYVVTKRGVVCRRCSDGASVLEKIMYNILSQLKVDFEFQKIFDWSNKNKSKNICGSKYYDFYLPSHKCIIEMHGRQHYIKSFQTCGGKSLEEEMKNDRIKQKLASNKVSKYIVINGSNPDFESIKNSILYSELSQLIDLSKIDWIECYKHARSSRVDSISQLWREKKTIRDIISITKLSRPTIIGYLKQGAAIGLCDYDPIKEIRKHKGKPKKPVVMLSLNGEYIDEFSSILEVKRRNIISNISHVCAVCKNKRKTANGYKWMYKEDYVALGSNKTVI